MGRYHAAVSWCLISCGTPPAMGPRLIGDSDLNTTTLRTISSQLTNGNDRDGTVSRSGIMVPYFVWHAPGHGATTDWGFSLPAIGEEPGRSGEGEPVRSSHQDTWQTTRQWKCEEI